MLTIAIWDRIGDDVSLNLSMVPIFCLNCRKFIRWGRVGETPESEAKLKGGGVNAKNWFCQRVCLYLYATRLGYDVKKPQQARDMMTGLIEEMRRRRTLEGMR